MEIQFSPKKNLNLIQRNNYIQKKFKYKNIRYISAEKFDKNKILKRILFK